MKNRLIITISDIHGSKQYSVHQIIKMIILAIVLILILIGVGTYLYIELLNNRLSGLKQQSVEYKKELKMLENITHSYSEKNAELTLQQGELVALIRGTTDKLYAVKGQLREVEDMIGYGPDLNASFHARLEEERSKAAQELKEEIKEEIQEEQLSTIQKTLLFNSIPTGKPITYKRISSGYGYRTHPVKKTTSFHPAVDLPAKKGTPVYAPASGVVVYAKRKGDYGKFMLLAHSFGFKTAYAHLSRYAVKSGDYVSKGDLIAYVGSTGRSTGSHLHYEVRYLDKWLNPRPFMSLDLDDINNISAKIRKVNWPSILQQTEKFIALATKE
jgi:murein DD-endopeptidase MepM/ murein hydrolase activator NlpD